jgi:mono/diheme cytochrome c family protein
MRAIARILAAVAAAITMQNTLAQDADPAKARKGEDVYRMYCSTCHGDDLKNSGSTFDLRRLGAAERSRFENSVQNGKNQMPPWKGVIDAEQMDQIWNYIRANAYDKK